MLGALKIPDGHFEVASDQHIVKNFLRIKQNSYIQWAKHTLRLGNIQNLHGSYCTRITSHRTMLLSVEIGEREKCFRLNAKI